MELVQQKKVGQMTGLLKLTAFLGFPGIIIIVIIGIALIASVINSISSTSGGSANVSPEVMRYEQVVRQFAKEYGIENYVPLLLCIMEQESHGQGGDPMQSSESVGLPPNSIIDPVVSIKYGVAHFKAMLVKANGEQFLAVQSYNFGGGFINYANERGGKYTIELAKEFSLTQSQKLGWSCSDWRNPYCYGDYTYTEKVMSYYQGSATASSAEANGYGFIYPSDSRIVTSPFGYRSDPINGAPSFHSGVDFSCSKQNIPIYSVKSGVVIRAGWENPDNQNQGFGQRVYIDNGDQVALYAHLSQINVKVGQTIQQGQSIGNCGTTGKSTGEHLHFELQQNGRSIDPLPYLK